MPARHSLLVLLFTAAAGSACSSSTPGQSAQNPGARVPAVASPAPVATPVPHDEHALHNVYRLAGGYGKLISGAVPEGDAGFDELSRMGIKTVISVDGAAPDVARANVRGLRYVHIPVTYAVVSPEQRLEIARAINDLPGPIYIHCHHGKHRGPAAAASAAVALGYITPEQGVAFMEIAGTAVTYQGLYHCVREASLASATELAAAPADFPEVRKVEGIVASMVAVDLAFEHIGEIRAAGWSVPSDHPDLVPAAEAGLLADSLRFSGEDPRVKAWGPGYQAKLAHAIEVATKLEDDILKGAAKEQLDAGYKLVQTSCKDCHAAYRDKNTD